MVPPHGTTPTAPHSRHPPRPSLHTRQQQHPSRPHPPGGSDDDSGAPRLLALHCDDALGFPHKHERERRRLVHLTLTLALQTRMRTRSCLHASAVTVTVAHRHLHATRTTCPRCLRPPRSYPPRDEDATRTTTRPLPLPRPSGFKLAPTSRRSVPDALPRRRDDDGDSDGHTLTLTLADDSFAFVCELPGRPLPG